MEKAKEIAGLVIKFIKDEMTEAERSTLGEWVSASPENQKVFDELSNGPSLQSALRSLYEFRAKVAATDRTDVANGAQ